MIIAVDPDSPVPPYEQVRAQLAGLIEAGTLATEVRLPTVRQLAGAAPAQPVCIILCTVVAIRTICSDGRNAWTQRGSATSASTT